MEYKNILGTIYSRLASTPPVINSALALDYGLRAPCNVEPGVVTGIMPGANVKLKLIFSDPNQKLTCHGKIDWVKTDSDLQRTYIGFGHLSLSEKEFKFILPFFTTTDQTEFKHVETLRDQSPQAPIVFSMEEAHEIYRLKAINFPVSIIEEIDEKRGSTGFSKFVISAVKQYLKEIHRPRQL